MGQELKWSELVFIWELFQQGVQHVIVLSLWPFIAQKIKLDMPSFVQALQLVHQKHTPTLPAQVICHHVSFRHVITSPVASNRMSSKFCWAGMFSCTFFFFFARDAVVAKRRFGNFCHSPWQNQWTSHKGKEGMAICSLFIQSQWDLVKVLLSPDLLLNSHHSV